MSALARVGNRILAGTDGDGVRVLEDGRLVSRLPIPSAPEGGRKLKVQQILDDRDGNLWLGVYQQGVICLPRKRYKFEYFGKMQHEDNPIGSGCVMAVFKDRDNTTRVSCDNEGIYHLDQDGSATATARCGPVHIPPELSACRVPDHGTRCRDWPAVRYTAWRRPPTA